MRLFSKKQSVYASGRVVEVKHKHMQKEYPVIKTVMFILLLLYALSLIFPLFWMFMASLKDQIEYSTGVVNGVVRSINAFPRQWLFSNYLKAFKELNDGGGVGFIGMFINSVWYSTLGPLISTLLCAMTGYVCAHYKFRGAGLLFNITIITMILPIQGNLSSLYKVVTKLRIIDSPLYVVFTAGGLGMNFLLIRSFFKNLSWSYAEAAFIDGAGHLQVFFRVMLPQVMPLLLTLASLGFIGGWNDYSTPLLMLKSFPTLSSGLYIFQMKTQRMMNMPVLYAGLLLSAIPVVALFSLMSDKIMDITLAGGLKG